MYFWQQKTPPYGGWEGCTTILSIWTFCVGDLPLSFVVMEWTLPQATLTVPTQWHCRTAAHSTFPTTLTPTAALWRMCTTRARRTMTSLFLTMTLLLHLTTMVEEQWEDPRCMMDPNIMQNNFNPCCLLQTDTKMNMNFDKYRPAMFVCDQSISIHIVWSSVCSY